jgi:predicted TIM-barrel fold metal-dependent hydrolase
LGVYLDAKIVLLHADESPDWPYLRAPQRQDYGPLVELVEVLFPDAADREKLFWKTPQLLFGFAA